VLSQGIGRLHDKLQPFVTPRITIVVPRSMDDVICPMVWRPLWAPLVAMCIRISCHDEAREVRMIKEADLGVLHVGCSPGVLGVGGVWDASPGREVVVGIEPCLPCRNPGE
jgi:hypothetical protein